MGKFFSSAYIINHQDYARMAVVLNLMVDTGSEATWVRAKTLETIGITPVKRLVFEMANGSRVARDVGFAIVQVGTRATTDEVVFAEKDDLELLGVRAMEGLRLVLDPHGGRMLYAGPALAAQNRPKAPKRGTRRPAAASRPITEQELAEFRDAEVIECTPMLDVRYLRKHSDGFIGLHTGGTPPTKAELDSLQVVKLHRNPRQLPVVKRNPRKR